LQFRMQLRSESTIEALLTRTPERRSILQPIELEERDGGMPLLKGHAAVFNSMSEDLGFFREIIRPGAFSDVIGAPDIVCLANHNVDRLIASVRSGSLQLAEDKRGLYMEADPNDTTICRDVVAEVRRRDMNGQSFSFDILSDSWRMENGVQVREVIKLERMYDVGPVVFPAYPATDVSARNLMAKNGVDVEGFSSALVKQVRGLDLSAADRDIFKRAIAILQLATEDRQEPEPPSAETAPSEAWRVAHLRRRLDLLTLSRH
jgi:Escherichia/Staphylococcus phage prohead protease